MRALKLIITFVNDEGALHTVEEKEKKDKGEGEEREREKGEREEREREEGEREEGRIKVNSICFPDTRDLPADRDDAL